MSENALMEIQATPAAPVAAPAASSAPTSFEPALGMAPAGQPPAPDQGAPPADQQFAAPSPAPAPQGFDPNQFAEAMARSLAPIIQQNQSQHLAPQPHGPSPEQQAFIAERTAYWNGIVENVEQAGRLAQGDLDMLQRTQQAAAQTYRQQQVQAQASQYQGILARDPRFDMADVNNPHQITALGIKAAFPNLGPQQHYEIFLQRVGGNGPGFAQAPTAQAPQFQQVPYGQQAPPARAPIYATPGNGAGAPAREQINPEVERVVAEGYKRGWIKTPEKEAQMRETARTRLAERGNYR